MKIKTVVEYVPEKFDQLVNDALEAGYVLGLRNLLPPDGNSRTAHYAQLVKLDEPPEPETTNPFEALRQVRAFCDTHEKCGVCPLYEWCCRLRNGGDPSDWILPEEVGHE